MAFDARLIARRRNNLAPLGYAVAVKVNLHIAFPYLYEVGAMVRRRIAAAGLSARGPRSSIIAARDISRQIVDIRALIRVILDQRAARAVVRNMRAEQNVLFVQLQRVAIDAEFLARNRS